MSTNGKGSARRRENFRAVQDGWDEIDWTRKKKLTVEFPNDLSKFLVEMTKKRKATN